MSARKKITYSARPNHAARSAHAKGERQFKTYDTSHIRPKRSKAPIVVSAVLAVVVLVALFFGGSAFLRSCSAGSLPEGQSVEVVVPEGSGAQAIGSLLQENGVIGNANEFVNRVTELGVAAELKPGTYTFMGGMTIDEVISQLRSGPEGAASGTFTLPEGLRLDEVAARVADAHSGSITAEDFIAQASNAEVYAADFPFVAGAYNNSLEGFLFPKTYPVNADATADSVIRMLLAQYQLEIAAIDYGLASERGLSPYQVLVMASLIEREATLDVERPDVASVIYNRIDEEMMLQIDASVAYAVGKVEIGPEDQETESPYNTYMNYGLPPGPICSPGLSSLQAAAQPADTDYLYYVVKPAGDGSHNFSNNYDDHLSFIEELQ